MVHHRFKPARVLLFGQTAACLRCYISLHAAYLHNRLDKFFGRLLFWIIKLINLLPRYDASFFVYNYLNLGLQERVSVDVDHRILIDTVHILVGVCLEVFHQVNRSVASRVLPLVTAVCAPSRAWLRPHKENIVCVIRRWSDLNIRMPYEHNSIRNRVWHHSKVVVAGYMQQFRMFNLDRTAFSCSRKGENRVVLTTVRFHGFQKPWNILNFWVVRVDAKNIFADWLHILLAWLDEHLA